MRRRSPLTLVPFAFLTLACGNPGAEPPTPPAPRADATAPGVQPRPKATRPYGRLEPLPKQRGAIRLASYNLENLFDDRDDPSISGAIDDKTMTTPPERLAALAATITALDADVLAVTEVESEAALQDFRDRYLTSLGYTHLVSLDAGDSRGIEQGVLSRFPIVSARNWPEERIDDMRAKQVGKGWAAPSDGQWAKHWARSPLEVVVKAPDGYELTLFVVHHKAGRECDAQRELEALQTLELVQERLKADTDLNLAILGDFNATPAEKSVAVYLDTVRPRLRNAYDERFQRNAPRETYATHASGRPIDYIVMSPGLFRDVVDASFFVLGTPIAPTARDPKPAGYASDHFPVAVDLRSDRPAKPR